ncbi:MAG: ABC transporter permease [Nitrospirota bacterium]
MIQIINIQRIGENIINAIRHSKGSYELFLNSIKNISALKVVPVRAVIYRQIYFTGIEALSKIATIGALIGIVIITQVTNIVGLNALLTGKILLWTVVRELGPLFAAIIIIARSCTAVASELGSMKVNREVDSLRIMGIDPLDYLIVPRIIGITVSVFILTFYFQIIAIAGGLALSSIFIDIPFLQHLRGIFSALSLFEIGVSLLKSTVFGMVISTVACYHGFRVQLSITEIPQATTIAVMQSLFLVFIFDGIITIISFV